MYYKVRKNRNWNCSLERTCSLPNRNSAAPSMQQFKKSRQKYKSVLFDVKATVLFIV